MVSYGQFIKDKSENKKFNWINYCLILIFKANIGYNMNNESTYYYRLKMGKSFLLFLICLCVFSYTYEITQDQNLKSKLGSCSRVYWYQTTNYNLDIEIDFEKRVIKGVQTLTIHDEAFPALEYTMYDIEGINIRSVKDTKNRDIDYQVLNFTDGSQGLKINKYIWYKTNPTYVIEYETSPNASGIHWYEKEDSNGKVIPSMYIQCETIHCRSVTPFQDSPNIRSEFTLKIKTTKDVMIKATGDLVEETTDEKFRYTTYESKEAFPVNMLSIFAGDFKEAKLNDRMSIITESDLNITDFSKFEDFQKIIEITESLMDDNLPNQKLFIAPSSFPKLGMLAGNMNILNSKLLEDQTLMNQVYAKNIVNYWFGNIFSIDSWDSM